VAIRGNGQAMLSHFAALARLAEHYGPADALAGGSSTSITMFVYESMLKNEALGECAEGACSAEDRALRLALLLKSMQGFIDAVGTNDGLLNNPALTAFVESIKELRAGGKSIPQLLSNPSDLSSVTEAATALARELDPAALERIGVLVNPELLAL